MDNENQDIILELLKIILKESEIQINSISDLSNEFTLIKILNFL